MIVVADYYQLGKFDGNNFDQDQKRLIRKGMKITEEYFELVNTNWQDQGKFFVKDEEATIKYYEESKKQMEERETRKLKREALANSALAEVLEDVKPKRKRRTKKEDE